MPCFFERIFLITFFKTLLVKILSSFKGVPQSSQNCTLKSQVKQRKILHFSSLILAQDVETGVWTKPADLTTEGEAPEGRRSHSALNLNGNLVVFGGFNSKTNKHKNDLWMYRPDKNSWQALTPSGKGPGPRRRQAFCLVVSRDLPEEGFIVKHFLKIVTPFSHQGSLDIVQSFHFR